MISRETVKTVVETYCFFFSISLLFFNSPAFSSSLAVVFRNNYTIVVSDSGMVKHRIDSNNCGIMEILAEQRTHYYYYLITFRGCSRTVYKNPRRAFWLLSSLIIIFFVAVCNNDRKCRLRVVL